MTKSKKFVSGMMLVLLVLTLVSFSFVGFTFARYTSTGTKSATVGVAKWDVRDNFGEQAVDFTNLSPSKEAYLSGTIRKHETALTDVAIITNNSDVDAKIEMNLTTIEQSLVAKMTDNSIIDQNHKGELDLNNNKIDYDTFMKVFKIEFYKDSEALTGDATGKVAVKLAKGDAMTLKAKVTWTSDLTGDTETTADKRDTIIAKNVKTLTFTVSYTAVQASQIPAKS